MKRFTKVDEYISHAPEEARPKLCELRVCLRSILPKAEEKIWYGVPFYHQAGEVVGFSFAKRHVSVGVGAAVLSASRRQKLGQMGYRTGTCTLQVEFHQKIPVGLLREMLREKVRWNQSKQAAAGGHRVTRGAPAAPASSAPAQNPPR